MLAKVRKSVLITRALLSLCENLSATKSDNNSIWAKLLYISFAFQHITIISVNKALLRGCYCTRLVNICF